jgi:hypothetical protein
MTYFVWRTRPTPGYCGLTGLKNVERVAELRNGVSREEGFPPDAALHMDPAHKKDTKLGDQIYNVDGLYVVSVKLRTMIDCAKPANLEWLPVTIFDHKGNVASGDHAIANPVDVIDCIDQKRSSLSWNPVDKDKISDCARLVLLEETLPAQLVLFRMKHLAGVVLVREDLAKALKAGGLVGTKIVELEEFTGS